MSLQTKDLESAIYINKDEGLITLVSVNPVNSNTGSAFMPVKLNIFNEWYTITDNNNEGYGFNIHCRTRELKNYFTLLEIFEVNDIAPKYNEWIDVDIKVDHLGNIVDMLLRG